MNNKQHEHILKAFLASKIPAAVYEHAPELVAVDSVIGGYCTRLLRRNKALKCPPEGLISKEERKAFAELINLYYRLAVLAEAVVLRYSTDTKEKI